MTEKRFTLVYGDENPFEWDLMDNQKDCLIVQGNGTAICELLNELYDETQFFKEECKHQQGQKMRLVAELKRLDYSEDDIRDIANGEVMWND